jgi:hypothetical protein
VSGIAVTIAARVAAAAGPGQILATSTIVQMVAGSGLAFTEVGVRELKGVVGTWELYALAAADDESIGRPRHAGDAREARERSAPHQTSKGSRRQAKTLGAVGVVVVLFLGMILLHRDHAPTTAGATTSGPEPIALVALRETTGEQGLPVDMPELRVSSLAGPIVFTGRDGTPAAFAWIPVGFRTYGLRVAQVNRTSGAIPDPGRHLAFGTSLTTCVCVAVMDGRIWTPLSPRKTTVVGEGETLGVSLRGLGLGGEPAKDVPLDDALAPAAVAALVSGGGYLWVGDSANDQVYRVDPAARNVDAFRTRQSADVLVFADGSLWVLDTLAGKITRMDPRTGSTVPPIIGSGDLRSMAVGGGFVWVTDASAGVILQIPEDLKSAPTPIPIGQFGGSPNAVAYDDGSIIVGFSGGMIAKINPADPSAPVAIWTQRVGNNATSVTVEDGIVWAAGGPTRSP